MVFFRRSLTALLVLAALPWVLAVRPVAADTLTVPLSNPGKPVRVEVSMVVGSITVVGAAVDAVTVNAIGDDDDDDAPAGMRRVSSGMRGVTVEESDNLIEISVSPARGGVDVEIQVPVATSARVSSVNGDEVEVRGVTGELDLHNTNGKIRAVDVSGPVSASTVNGDVEVELSAAAAHEEMAFSTLNGDVKVTLPDGYGANVSLRSDNGGIYSDFDVTTHVAKNDDRKRRKSGKKVEGTINGGGPALLLRTFNGDILLHKNKP